MYEESNVIVVLSERKKNISSVPKEFGNSTFASMFSQPKLKAGFKSQELLKSRVHAKGD